MATGLLDLPHDMLVYISCMLQDIDRTMFALSCKTVYYAASDGYQLKNDIPYSFAGQLTHKSRLLPQMRVHINGDVLTQSICNRITDLAINRSNVNWLLFSSCRRIEVTRIYFNAHNCEGLRKLNNLRSLIVNGRVDLNNLHNITDLVIRHPDDDIHSSSIEDCRQLRKVVYNGSLDCRRINNCTFTYVGEIFIYEFEIGNPFVAYHCGHVESIGNDFVYVHNARTLIVRYDYNRGYPQCLNLNIRGRDIDIIHIYLETLTEGKNGPIRLTIEDNVMKTTNGMYLYVNGVETSLRDYTYTVDDNIPAMDLYDVMTLKPTDYGVREFKISFDGLFDLYIENVDDLR